MRRRLFRISGLLLLLLLCSSCEKPQKKPDPEVGRNAAVERIAEKHGAVQNWAVGLSMLPHTADIQDALLGRNKPIQFQGRVSDVFYVNGDLFADFSCSPISGNNLFNLQLRLQISQELRQKLHGEIFTQFVIIALVVKVTPTTILEASGSGDEVQIESQTTRLVTGKCIALEKLP